MIKKILAILGIILLFLLSSISVSVYSFDNINKFENIICNFVYLYGI